MLKVEAVSKKKPKFFVEGMPKDFTLVGKNGSEIKATLSGVGSKAYNLSITTGKTSFDSTSIREIAEHFAELADMLDAKLAA